MDRTQEILYYSEDLINRLEKIYLKNLLNDTCYGEGSIFTTESDIVYSKNVQNLIKFINGPTPSSLRTKRTTSSHDKNDVHSQSLAPTNVTSSRYSSNCNSNQYSEMSKNSSLNSSCKSSANGNTDDSPFPKLLNNLFSLFK
jgi:hypothetical protein